MTVYTLTYEDDLCQFPDAAWFAWLVHELTGHRWPDAQGWAVVADDGIVLATTRDIFADTESCRDAMWWAANEIQTYTGQDAPDHLEGWRDLTQLGEDIRFEIDGASALDFDVLDCPPA